MIRLVLLLAMLVPACGQEIAFTKSFPGSNPAWVQIVLKPNGACTFTDQKDDENPLTLKLSEADARSIFELADKVERFKRPLESPVKVANMGQKTFTFAEGTAKTEVSFNYTSDPDGRVLTDWFERISESGQAFFYLERTVKFDKLGVNQSILQLEKAMDRKRIVSAESFLPLLDRVAKNDGYMNMARNRAGALAAAIRAQGGSSGSSK